TPAASIFTTASPGLGVGSGTSSWRRASGPPGVGTRTAFMEGPPRVDSGERAPDYINVGRVLPSLPAHRGAREPPRVARARQRMRARSIAKRVTACPSESRTTRTGRDVPVRSLVGNQYTQRAR